MAQEDISEKTFIALNDVFADVFNALVFEGKQMMAEDEITNVLKKYIQDYRVHVFDIPRLSREQVQMFRSDFRIVADYFTKVYTKDEYVPDDVVIQHVDEFLKLMKVLTKDKRFEEATRAIAEKEKEELRMRSFFAESEARGEARGKEIGKEIGEARMGKLIGILLSQNLIEEAKKVTDDKEERERYYILYNI